MVEEEVYGINHALVGQLALQHWGLSWLIVEIVTQHHAPGYFAPADLGLDRESLQYLLVIFLADQAALIVYRKRQRRQLRGLLTSSLPA
jgi:hypothetical protein